MRGQAIERKVDPLPLPPLLPPQPYKHTFKATAYLAPSSEHPLPMPTPATSPIPMRLPVNSFPVDSHGQLVSGLICSVSAMMRVKFSGGVSGGICCGKISGSSLSLSLWSDRLPPLPGRLCSPTTAPYNMGRWATGPLAFSIERPGMG